MVDSPADPKFYILNEVFRLPCDVWLFTRPDCCDFFGFPSTLNDLDLLAVIWSLRAHDLLDIRLNSQPFKGSESEFRQLAIDDSRWREGVYSKEVPQLIYGLTKAGGDALEEYLEQPDWNYYLRIDGIVTETTRYHFPNTLDDWLIDHYSNDDGSVSEAGEATDDDELFNLMMLSCASVSLLEDVFSSLNEKYTKLLLLPRQRDIKHLSPWPATYWKTLSHGVSAVVGFAETGIPKQAVLPARVWSDSSI